MRHPLFFLNWTFIYLVVRFLAIVWALPIKPTTLTNDIYILSSRFSLAKKIEFDTIPCFLFLSLFFFSSLLIYFSHPGTNQIMLLFLQWRRRERSVFFLNFSSVCLRRNSFRQILFSVLAFTHTHTHISKVEKKITAENDQNSASILYNKNNSTTHSSGISTKRLSPPPPSDLYNFFFDDRTSCVYIFLYSRAKTK